MKTLRELIYFPVDIVSEDRKGPEPTPEEKAVVVNAYLKDRYWIQDKFEPGDRLPFVAGFNFMNHEDLRYQAIHEWAILWFIQRDRDAKALN